MLLMWFLCFRFLQNQHCQELVFASTTLPVTMYIYRKVRKIVRLRDREIKINGNKSKIKDNLGKNKKRKVNKDIK